MIAKLSKEVTDALHATNDGQVEAIDPETGRVYFVVDGEIHRQAMEALRRQQDHDAIARGIADMEAGRTVTAEEAHRQGRQQLISRYQQMSFRLRVTQTARDDITRNASWWAEHHSPDQALEFYDMVYKQLNTLLEMPQSQGLPPENDEFSYEIRQMPVGLGSRPSYRAVYTIDDDAIYVLAVHRGAQDRLSTSDLLVAHGHEDLPTISLGTSMHIRNSQLGLLES